MDKTLFLLGLIRNSDMYGYQINELIDAHFGLIVSITRPTAYRLLNKMLAKGWISAREERIGNRPPRKIYAITPDGETAFLNILRQNLAEYGTAHQSGAVSLAFLHMLPPEELLPLLEKRRDTVEDLLKKLEDSQQHQSDYHLMFDNQHKHLTTELDWTENIIARFQSGSL